MTRCQINPKFANSARLLSFVESLPAVFADGGKLIWDGRNKIKLFTLAADDADSGDMHVIVKRFKHLNLLQKIIYIFRRSKASKAFRNGMELCRRGFDTPTPIACVETRQGPCIKEMFYLCDETTLQSIEGQTDRPDWNKGLAAAFARYAAALHGKGILHNDLNDTNVLYAPLPDGDFRFAVIDINRMKFYPEGQRIPDRECIENLTRFTGRIDLFEHVIREYAKARGLDEEDWANKAVAQKRRHDRNWYRRKRLLHPMKKKYRNR